MIHAELYLISCKDSYVIANEKGEEANFQVIQYTFILKCMFAYV